MFPEEPAEPVGSLQGVADQSGHPSSHGSGKCRCRLVAGRMHWQASFCMPCLRTVQIINCAAASCACLLLLLCLGVEGGHQPDDLALLHHCVDVQHCLVPCTGNAAVSSLWGGQFGRQGAGAAMCKVTPCMQGRGWWASACCRQHVPCSCSSVQHHSVPGRAGVSPHQLASKSHSGGQQPQCCEAPAK